MLVATSSSGAARLGALIYGAGLIALFAGSGLYHRWPWDPRWRPLLRRIDHSTIFVFIAASYTPLALLVLHGTTQALVLAGVWLGALAGVTLSVAWIDAPRWLGAATYLALGWVALLAIPQLVDAAARGAAGADRRRRRPLLARRRHLRDAAPGSMAADVRLPRALPRVRDRRGRLPRRRDRRLGAAGGVSARRYFAFGAPVGGQGLYLRTPLTIRPSRA